MPLIIDEAFLPATLSAPAMTDQQFAAFCADNPDLFFEMTAAGEIIVTPPNFSLTGIRNREITSQPDRWASVTPPPALSFQTGQEDRPTLP